MSEVRFVYMEPVPHAGAVRPRFRTSAGAAMKLVRAELQRIGARNVTVLAGFRHIRNDGWPYASSETPAHPAVAVQFLDASGNTLVFRGTQYNSYGANLRAIGLTLAALRAVSRYGVVTDNEQYRGFKQLEAPEGDRRLATLREMAANGTTEGERAAAQAALDRIVKGL